MGPSGRRPPPLRPIVSSPGVTVLSRPSRALAARHLGPLLGLLACGSGKNSDGDDIDDGVDDAVDSGQGAAEAGPTDYDPGLGESAAPPEFDRAFIERSLQVVFEVVPTLHAGPVLARYRDAMSSADPGCPSRYESEGNAFWYADCTSESGTRYSGYAFDYNYEDTDVYGDGNLWDVQVFSGAAVFEAEGSRMELSGSANLGQSVQEGYVVSVSDVRGWTALEGDRWSDGSWVSDGVHPSLSLYAYGLLEGEGKLLTADGLIGGLSEALPGVDLMSVAFGDAGVGFPCLEEPGGELALRDADGHWWVVVFDVDAEAWRRTGECDGCGAVYFQGEQVGEACADPSPLLDWEGAPWSL